MTVHFENKGTYACKDIYGIFMKSYFRIPPKYSHNAAGQIGSSIGLCLKFAKNFVILLKHFEMTMKVGICWQIGWFIIKMTLLSKQINDK